MATKKVETSFRIRTNKGSIWKRTTKSVGEYVWVNKKTKNMELKKPGMKRIDDFQAYKVYLITSPTENSINAPLVL